MWGRIVAGAVLLIAVVLAATSCGTIETGNVGVRTTLGKVNAEEVEPGLYLGVPVLSQVQAFSAKEIAVELNDLTPKARDNLSLRDLDVTVYYKVAAGSIAELYVKYAARHARADGAREFLPAFLLVQAIARNVIYEESSKLDSLGCVDIQIAPRRGGQGRKARRASPPGVGPQARGATRPCALGYPGPTGEAPEQPHSALQLLAGCPTRLRVAPGLGLFWGLTRGDMNVNTP